MNNSDTKPHETWRERVKLEFYTYPKTIPQETFLGGNDEWDLIPRKQLEAFIATKRTNVLAQVKELIGEQVTFEFPLARGDAGQRVFIDLEELEKALKKLEDQNE